MTTVTRTASISDIDVFYELLTAHAAELRMPLVATKEKISELFFSGHGAPIYAILAEIEGEAVGFLIWYYNFSTFLGARGMYAEDVYVKPSARPLGVANALGVAVDAVCIEERLPRREWVAFDNNPKATAYFLANGGVKLEGRSAWRKEFSFGDRSGDLEPAERSLSGTDA